MKKARNKYIIPDLTEYTDDEGRKWVQTSMDDLFSIQELNDILENVEKKDDGKEIVLARIDFQKVNKEYYEAVIDLQKKLHERNELLKRVVKESREMIDRKNRKLRELINYIKEIHSVMPRIQAGEISMPVPVELGPEPAASDETTPLVQKTRVQVTLHESEYEDVTEEVLLDGSGIAETTIA